MNFERDVEFFVLLEEMKKIKRMTKVIGTENRENDAEHTWHIATMALFMEKYATQKVDINKVIKMLLVHDLVEIFAGDTFAFNENLNIGKLDRELKSMEKLKSYLDSERGEMLENLWLEFENKQTYEAQFANALDRVQPMIANIFSESGGSWSENKVRFDQVLKRAQIIKVLDDSVYNYLEKGFETAVEKGYLIRKENKEV